MIDTLVWFRLSVALVGALCTALLFMMPELGQTQLAQLFSTERGQYLTVAFLDVGQGDAIYIETPDGVQVLIDGGPDASVLRELSTVMPFWDRSLDAIVATHPDKDHIGGLVDVLTRYDVKRIVRTENESDTAVASAFIFTSTDEDARIHIAQAGEEIVLGASTTLTILSPTGDPQDWESNQSSIVAQLRYGDIEFMLTGDAPIGIEEYLVQTHGKGLESEVLKLGHHGSRTSTADIFLAAVQPTYAIVSAGADNRYGHPHTEVVESVISHGATLMSTAEKGTMVFYSDGERVWSAE
jgi:competence protein ComEC